MKKYLMCLVMLGWLSACEKNAVPDFVDLSGQGFSAQSFVGQWVVINYFAQWCKPCIKEIPELNALHNDRNNYNALVLGVNYDAMALEQLTQVSGEMGIKFPVLRSDPAAKLQLQRPQALPVTFIIGPSGQLRHTLAGPQTVESIVEKLQQSQEPEQG